jgi:hypothetical protein
VVECYSSLVPGHILVVQLLASPAEPVAVPVDLGAAVDAVETRFDRMCLDRIQPGGSLLGTLETKRPKRKLPVEVLALREGSRVLGIATNCVSWAYQLAR